MTISHNYLRTRVRLDHLVANYRLLRAKGGHVLAVVKADAYGHGLIETARALSLAGCDMFAIGSVAEGAALRAAGEKGGIVSLLGPVLPEDDAVLLEHDIIPFIYDFGQLERLAANASRLGRRARIAIKCDTGMARLGFTEADVPRLLARLADFPSLEPVMAASHLATADDPEAFDQVAAQGACFGRICQALRQAGLVFEASLCNSAGILAHADTWGFDCRRAGVSLYGINPFRGTRLASLGEGLLPTMETVTRVVFVHDLPKGGAVSYGRTFVADRDMRVAIVAAGYADAYSRGLSNRGFMELAGRRVPILGRVCMQLTAVDATGLDVAPGDGVYLLGGSGEGAITADELALWWGTIPYEVFCLLGLNPRTSVSGEGGAMESGQ